MSKLVDLYEHQGQSPWLDNLKRGWITSGELSRWVDRGIRGITSNPSIFAKAIEGAHDYDDQFRTLVTEGQSVEDSYWRMVVDDISEALRLLRPVFDSSKGGDGFVSVEVSPALALDTMRTIDEAHELWNRIAQPNLFVKIP
ncbi:MAG: transaldolase, partial [Acidimicrobiaceae bacterium]